MTDSPSPILAMEQVRVMLRTRNAGVAALSDIELDLWPGEIMGLVGESGGGKSMLARTIAGMLPETAELSGTIHVAGRDIVKFEEQEMKGHRGGMAALCLQNPRAALSPTRRVGKQLVDRLMRWQGLEEKAAWEEAHRSFVGVGIRDPARRLRAYSHELSGGMCQRVMIAIALACRPRILLADEPTTGLDSTLTREILAQFRSAAHGGDCSVLVVSHDIASIAEICDRIAVLYAGVLVESGPAADIVSNPHHPYTQALVSAIPGLDGELPTPVAGSMPRLDAAPASCPYAERCQIATSICRDQLPEWRLNEDGRGVRCFHAGEFAARRVPATSMRPTAGGTGQDPIAVLDRVEVRYTGQYGRPDSLALRGVSLKLKPAETLGVVGESGCGKSTLARVIAGLVPPTSGTALVNGQDFAKISFKDKRKMRRDVQMVFQDPVDSLSPKMTVAQNIRDPLRALGWPREGVEARVDRFLSLVGLETAFRHVYPRQLSGGQAQRVAIARALIVDPSLIVFDEPTSALDVTVQAQILDLLRQLMAEGNRSYLFVSHDLAAVRGLCDRVAVLYLGKIVELGRTSNVLAHPLHPYTRALVEASPNLSGQRKVEETRLRRDLDEAYEADGCALETRCPYAEADCRKPQALAELRESHYAACWKAPDLLQRAGAQS